MKQKIRDNLADAIEEYVHRTGLDLPSDEQLDDLVEAFEKFVKEIIKES